VARASAEPDPDLLRSYGEVLGALPEGAVSAAQVESLAHIFEIPNAPCQIVTRVPGDEDLGRLARQTLNPRCSVDGWLQVVIALDGATKQSIVHGKSGDAADDDADADFRQLMVEDDDGDSAADAQGDGIDVDFNKLSQVLAGLRPEQAVSLGAIAASVTSILLLVAGTILFLLAWRNRAKPVSGAVLA
jgi:hypothetical protein